MRAKVGSEKEFLMANESLRELDNSDETPDQSIRSTSCRSNQSSGFIIKNMKLNFKLPKSNKRDSPRVCLFEALKSVALLTLFVSLVHVDSHQFQEPTSSNEISQQRPTNFSQLSRDVTNLRMIPDLRSIRLRWNYVQPNTSHISPAAFEIRFCELTSWMAEIKCRHRNLPVAAGQSGEQAAGPDTQETTTLATNFNHSSVIPHGHKQLDTTVVRLLTSEPVAESTPFKSAIDTISSSFETHIYDLRALTNYTFNVHVSRFNGEPRSSHYHQVNTGTSPVRTQARPARRMDLTGGGALNELHSSDKVAKSAGAYRAETKPFQAEALKCLANSSEVLVNTGRYFGGRISVEGQPFDSRCQLVGNKESSQTSYLFRIDHEICRSKVIDSNRIETMILVHENKDILTHNTARFLVQCNIMQKSFTVKASVSLPKINSLNQQQVQPSAQARPATITLLQSKPINFGTNSLNRTPQDEQLVRLGSIPGVYRIIRAGDNATQSVGSLNQVDTKAANPRYDEVSKPTTETNENSASRTVPPAEGQAAVSARRSKELLTDEKQPGQDKSLATGDNYQVELPKPVEVSSKILFVARANSDVELAPPQATYRRGARLGPTSVSFVRGSGALSSSLQVAEQSQPFQLLDGRRDHKSPQISVAVDDNDNDRARPMRTKSRGQLEYDSNWALASMAQPIIMTNNHRVANEFPSLAQLGATNHRGQKTMATTGVKETNPTTDYSIKYSPSNVAEYSLERLAFDGHNLAQNSNQLSATDSQPVQIRSRSGRMRQIVTTPQVAASFGDVGWGEARRTGDVLPQSDLIGAESAPSKNLVSILPFSANSSNTTVSQQVSTITNGTSTVSPTLAQNITGALIRWSLKTLGNLARKSFESLIDERDSASTGDNQTRGTTGLAPQSEERVRDGFLVEGLSRSVKARAQPTASTTTSATGLQQSIKAATQSADLVQSKVPHNLNPPPLLMGPSLKQATTVALSATTSSTHVTPSSVKITTKPPNNTQQHHSQSSQHPQRQQKSAINQSSNFFQSKSNSEQHQQAVRTSAQLDGRDTNSVPTNEGQTTPDSTSLGSLWPVYLLWALIGSAVVLMLVVYFVTLSPSSTQIFKPSCSSRHYNHGQQPHSGFLSQLNDALHWHHHSTRDQCLTSVPNLYNSSKSTIQQSDQQQQLQVNTISRLLPDSDVRSPSVQRRRRPDDDPSGTLRLTSPDASDLGSASTRSTSAASTANLSTRTESSLEEHENYCKNHEQFVYSDYLLLNSSDCLANDCGRESFA